MKAVYTEPVRTVFTFEQAEAAMRWALKCQLDADPRDEVVALALAKTALETGRWKSCWNGNWGNIKAGEKYEGQYTCILLNEVLRRGGRDVVVWFRPEGELVGGPTSPLKGAPIPVPEGHPQTRMRAYANHYDGALSYVEFVAGGMYAKAWQSLLRGDATQYVYDLKAKGYFTADVNIYAKSVDSIFREFLSRIRRLPDVPEAEVDWSTLRAQLPILSVDWDAYNDERQAALATA